jgi:hypothetical protein
MLSNMSVPGLISEKIRLKSRIQSRNYLLGEFRKIVKRENERDSRRIAEIEKRLNAKKPRTHKTTFLFI